MTRPALSVVLLTALAYAITGVLSAPQTLLLPVHAAAVYPPAGIALVVTLIWGLPGLVGTAIGAGAANLFMAVTAWGGPFTPADAAASLTIGVGAAAQAGLGRALVRRFVTRPLVLAEIGDVLRFYLLGGPLACLASASVAVAVLVAAGRVTPAAAGSTWVTWWLGDVLGVLLIAPVVLALFGRPRQEWAARRTVLALPMLLAAALLAAAIGWASHTHTQQLRAAFERDAWGLVDALDTQLRRPLDVLLAMHGLFDSQHEIEPAEMARASAPWLGSQPFIAAIGYSEKVDPTAVAAFEARARAEGPAADYRVFDRSDDRPAAPSPLGVVAIRLIEPLAANRGALGVNAMSIRAARMAIQRAAASGESVATAAFRLTQNSRDGTGIVLYRALYQGSPQNDAQRRAAFRGVVFVTLRPEELDARIGRRIPAHLSWCLVDLNPGTEQPRLAGPPGCDTRAAGSLHYARAHVIGPNALQWRVDAEPQHMPDIADRGTTLFAASGAVAAGLLGTLLLTMSGRQRRIEQAVTDRTADLRATGRALQDSQARLRSIVDHIPIGVVYADGSGRVHEANPALLGMLALPALPQPAPALADWTHPADQERLATLLQKLHEGAAPVLREQLHLRSASGAELTVRLALSLLRDGDAQPQRLVGVVEDIGEHLKLEASERALQAAEAASHTKSEFVGRMSHELRTPLNAMLGFAQLLARDGTAPLSSHQRRWVDQVQDAGWHLLNMINDTLDLSRIESGALHLNPMPLDPRALIEATQSMVLAAAERHRVQLQAPQVEPGTPPLWGDETRVKQILTNLLSNAIKYNVEGGRVDVQVAAADDGQVAIRVRDSGAGLSAEQLGRLFQPFERLGRERSGIEGTGIGLVISRLLAESMGGTLQAHSVPGQGSVFELRLPRARGAGTRSTAIAPLADEVAYRRRRVHYVEDNETNVVLMQGMLAQRPQIELTVSSMGLDALAALRIERPDLLLLDMHLPDIDGLDLLSHLKADDATAGIPVIVLSADATAQRVQRALDAGAHVYLPKPLDMAELLQHIDAILTQTDTVWGE